MNHLEVPDKNTEVFFPNINYWFYRKYSVNNTPEYTKKVILECTVALHDEASSYCPKAGGPGTFSNINCISSPGRCCSLLSSLLCTLLSVAALTHLWHHSSGTDIQLAEYLFYIEPCCCAYKPTQPQNLLVLSFSSDTLQSFFYHEWNRWAV